MMDKIMNLILFAVNENRIVKLHLILILMYAVVVCSSFPEYKDESPMILLFNGLISLRNAFVYSVVTVPFLYLTIIDYISDVKGKEEGTIVFSYIISMILFVFCKFLVGDMTSEDAHLAMNGLPVSTSVAIGFMMFLYCFLTLCYFGIKQWKCFFTIPVIIILGIYVWLVATHELNIFYYITNALVVLLFIPILWIRKSD